MHYGIDIAAPIGTPLFASKAGTIIEVSEENGGYGKYFIIDHKDGTKTLYAHCNSIFVSVGDTVTKGEHVAAVGSTGRSTEPHLHFEIRINGEKVNPALYLNVNEI
jgi:murein DD-endopeptidase MepM/ murein hydrolase activator NlpD